MNRIFTPVKVAIGIFVLFFCWWISDIPIGYYQFKQMCEKEGGLRSFSKVEPNVGWWATSEANAEGILVHYPNVLFTRFLSKDGQWTDMRYKGGYGSYSQYDVTPSDQSKKPRYREVLREEKVANAIRLRKEILIVLDESSNQAAFQTARFIFTWTNPETTLLGRSDSVVCPTYQNEHLSIQSLLKVKE